MQDLFFPVTFGFWDSVLCWDNQWLPIITQPPTFFKLEFSNLMSITKLNRRQASSQTPQIPTEKAPLSRKWWQQQSFSFKWVSVPLNSLITEYESRVGKTMPALSTVDKSILKVLSMWQSWQEWMPASIVFITWDALPWLFHKHFCPPNSAHITLSVQGWWKCISTQHKTQNHSIMTENSSCVTPAQSPTSLPLPHSHL